ncbi:uncharacterized protein LOC125686110 isoform X3 [Lagopus muta]|uniref:uncharacterized protein LOC125686110 isoform X3 n=1 Tax=Lagopus muta TaxID=64668 RepID=UPI00209F360F|nr:uncharacterized protein LOC125686110 isoform X3 [Lagopus muta]
MKGCNGNGLSLPPSGSRKEVEPLKYTEVAAAASGTGVQMKFYYDFLESINGKENLEKVVLKVPWLLDLVVSRVVAAASLMSSGRAVVFPSECVCGCSPAWCSCSALLQERWLLGTVGIPPWGAASNGSLHPAHRPGNPAGPQERRCPLSAGTRKVSSCWKVGGVTL